MFWGSESEIERRERDKDDGGTTREGKIPRFIVNIRHIRLIRVYRSRSGLRELWS